MRVTDMCRLATQLGWHVDRCMFDECRDHRMCLCDAVQADLDTSHFDRTRQCA